MKVYQYYKDLPPWAKGVVVVGGAVVVYLVGSRVYRAVFPTEAQKKKIVRKPKLKLKVDEIKSDFGFEETVVGQDGKARLFDDEYKDN